jgi:hypothetical protein
MREHLPATAALLEGRIDDHISAMESLYLESKERIAAVALCIECHSLMLGDYTKYCPYQREGAGAHTQAMLLNNALGRRLVNVSDCA